MTKNVIGKECKFAIHIPSKHRDIPDIHLIKEAVHYDDGTIEPHVKFIKDYKRPYYITKQSKRTHKEKKEWEHESNLLKYEVTQSELRNSIAKSLDENFGHKSLKELCCSPYVYGADITSTSLIKKSYQDKYNNLFSPFKVAAFDVETNVLDGSQDVIMASLVMTDKAIVAVDQNFVRGIANPIDRIKALSNKYIGEYLEKHKIDLIVKVVDGPVEIIKAVFEKAHEWKPDFLAIWNMDFDIPKILDMLTKNKVDPKDVLCDPCVPKPLRICKYKQGAKKKVTAGGRVVPINPAMQWHTLELTASFYVIDAMCSYKYIRITKQEEPSYALDAILQKELGIRKLKFKEADAHEGLAWHQFMQSNYKIEYVVYNIFDSLSMIELDEKTKDLSFTLPNFSATTDFCNFKSQPKKIADALYYDILTKGYVLATVGSAKKLEEDTEESDGSDEDDLNIPEETVLGLKGWILALKPHMSVLGIPLIKEDPNLRTNIRLFNYDSDATSAYPTATSVGNVSKETTIMELIDIVNIPEETFRMNNLNMILGRVNSIEYSTEMFNLPKPEELITLLNLN